MQEALSSPEAAQWKEAMDTEMDAMKSNHTWELLPLARGAKPLRVMWVFTLKGGTEGEGGEKLRFKARLVAKECSQRPGLDFGEVYAPVGRAQTIRSVLAMAAARDLEVHHHSLSQRCAGGGGVGSASRGV